MGHKKLDNTHSEARSDQATPLQRIRVNRHNEHSNTRISAELKNPKTINCQEFNPQAMLEIKTLTQDYNQWLEQTTEGTFTTDIKQISKQQLRQIILRVTLIDYIRSAIVEATSPHSKSTITNIHR